MATAVPSPIGGETAAELRALYREAEARAARLRVIVEAGRALAASPPEAITETARIVAQQAAHLAGFARGRIVADGADGETDGKTLCLPLGAESSGGMSVGTLVFDWPVTKPCAEDEEALAIVAQLIGGALAARAREARLAGLLGELVSAQEAERRRIAHELHDGIAQSAAALARRLDLAADGDPADLARAAGAARALVRELRQVIAGMRPPALDDLGLGPALSQLAEEVSDTIAVALAIELEARPAAHLEAALFRIVQEGLNNIRAHAGADARAVVRIAQAGARIKVEISDNGPGFDPCAAVPQGPARGFGLAFMRERVERLGGCFTIISAPGKGCRLSIELPAA